MTRWNSALRCTLAATLFVTLLPRPAVGDGPDVDAAIDQLIRLDPAALVSRFGDLKGDAEAQAAEAAALRAKAEQLEADAESLGATVGALLDHAKALSMAFLEMAEAGAMAAAPSEEMLAEDSQVVFTNYVDDVMPIFQARCMRCHNADNQRGGLNLATHGALLQGGSSGEVVQIGNPDNSRLLRLIMHAEEPVMPPSGEPLNEEQIDVVRRWIQEGALANADSKPMATAKDDTPGPGDGQVFVAATFVEGPPPMPEVEIMTPASLSHRGVVARAIATSPTAPLLAVGSHRQVLLYDLEGMELIGALPFPEGEIFTMDFSVNGELLVVGGGREGDSGICAVYHIRSAERTGAYGEAYDTVLAAAISPDHRMIAVGGPNRRVRVYSAETGAELYNLDPHTDWILSVKFTPDGEVLATADRGGNLFLWQAANGRAVEQLRGHEGAIHALDYTPDSLFLASAGADGTVQLWDTWQYTRVRTWKAHDGPVLELAVSKNNEIATTSSVGAVKRFNLEGAEQLAYAGLPDWGYQVAFSPEGDQILAGTWTGDIHVWDAASGEAVTILTTNPHIPEEVDPFAVAQN